MSSDVERLVMPLCEHLADWKNELFCGYANCGRKAKYIIHYNSGDKKACGIHANAYNKRAKRHGWKLAEPLKAV